ncbi:MAG: hypothetical protein CMJ58_22610 [Planctomycetaceae bacterium]|nr:hypothetical protein [Planctomycetaceae bacterium]
MGLFSWLLGDSTPLAELGGSGDFRIEVVGESNYQRELRAVVKAKETPEGGKLVQARLYLEDDNPYDKKAVRVAIDGRTVGYLSRENARLYRRELEKSAHPRVVGVCAAKIYGGQRKPDRSRKSFGVWLDIPANG